MFVELHILQNFVPSNLNRDDTNSPKDCDFGGYRRARISSQALKRAIRTSFRNDALVPSAYLATRTKRLVQILTQMLQAETGRSTDEAQRVAEAAVGSMGLGLKGEETQYLLFLGNQEISALRDACIAHWDTLAAAAVDGDQADAKRAKKAKKDAVPPVVGEALKNVLNGGQAADLALFGRMLADLSQKNRDAASQVAHAISTHAVNPEFDFYTAVDDLKNRDTDDMGAGMMGTIEFNSACFYRYANVDTDELLHNLDGDTELAAHTLQAFLRASISAIPSGKQNSMAAHNPPSLVFVTVRTRGLQNLANAFVRPVTPNGDLVASSARALNEHYGALCSMYGDAGLQGSWLASVIPSDVTPNFPQPVPVSDLVQRVADAVSTAVHPQ